MEEKAVHPIGTIRRHVTELEAALTLANAEPTHKAVHRLRTTTRRVEAVLALVEELAAAKLGEEEAAAYAGIAKKASRRLRKLRRAAGQVRDLDVQDCLIEDVVSAGSTAELRDDAARLGKWLKRRRAEEADVLLEIIEQQSKKFAPLLEQLLESLKPAESLAIAPVELSARITRWYEREQARYGKDPDDADVLHGIRKSAKLARYMAETGGKTTGALAKKFESLQEAGGKWHDLLTLAVLARKHLGDKAPLARLVVELREEALSAFRQKLSDFA